MLLEYQLDWIKIVDFLLIAKILVISDNHESHSSVASARVILKQIRQRLRVAVSREEKW